MWQRIKEFGWNWRGVLITTPAIATLIWLVRLTGFLQLGELAAYDQFMRWRPKEPIDDSIIIVGINREDIDKVGRGAIADAIYADLLTTLAEMEPRVIGLDIYRDVPVEPGHAELNAVFRKYPNIFGIEKVVGQTKSERVGAPPVLKELGRIGFNDLVVDPDNYVRRALVSAKGTQGEQMYSLAMQLTNSYLLAAGINAQIAANTDNWWQFGDVVLEPLGRDAGGYMRVDAGGYQTFINYRGGVGTFAQVSLFDVLEGRVKPEQIKDRIVLIGDITEVSKDLFPVPYTLEPSQRMSGVEVHAHIVSQVVRGALGDRPLIRTWTEWQENLWLLFWTGLGATLAWGLRNTGGKSSTWSWERVFGLGGSSLLLVVGCYWALVHSWWIPVIPPMLGLSMSAIAITGYIARSAGQIRNTFGRYLSDEIVATLLESPEGLRLGGERRTITILTSDLRGFTGISERLDPEEVVKILNLYLSDMADVITSYLGTIDEFMGDGILVLFGAPLPRPDDPERAIACAIAMQLALGSVNERITAMGLAPFEMGIGINTGEVVVGNIGSEKRAKYGVVGSQVNLTYRIESYTTGGQILISEHTYELLKDILDIRGTREVSPKGVKTAITIYEVAGIRGEHNLFLPEVVETFCHLPEAIAVEFSVLQGKDIVEDRHQAYLTQLSEREAHLCLAAQNGELPPDALANLKLNFVNPENEAIADDFYAKVVENTEIVAPQFHIRFTMRPPQIHAKFTQLYQAGKQHQPAAPVQ